VFTLVYFCAVSPDHSRDLERQYWGDLIYGFISVVVVGEETPQYVFCHEVLADESLKTN
jgi:hypothetical protein